MIKINWKVTATILFIILSLIVGILIGNYFTKSTESNSAINEFGPKVETKNLEKCEVLGQITRTGPFEMLYCIKVDNSDNLYLSKKITDMPDLAAYFYCTYNALSRTWNNDALPNASGNYETILGPISKNGYERINGTYGLFFGGLAGLNPDVRQVPTEKDLLTGYTAINPEETYLKTDLINYDQLVNEAADLYGKLIDRDNPRPDLRVEYLSAEQQSNNVSDKIVQDCVLISDKLRVKNSFPSQNELISNFAELFFEDFESLFK
jgi:hypothetical protein